MPTPAPHQYNIGDIVLVGQDQDSSIPAKIPVRVRNIWFWPNQPLDDYAYPVYDLEPIVYLMDIDGQHPTWLGRDEWDLSPMTVNEVSREMAR